MLKSEGLPIYCVNTPFSQFLRLQLGDVWMWNLFKRSNGPFGKCVIGNEDDDDDGDDDVGDVGDDGDVGDGDDGDDDGGDDDGDDDSVQGEAEDGNDFQRRWEHF